MFIRGVSGVSLWLFHPRVVVGGSFLAPPEAAFPVSVWFLGGGAVPSQEGCQMRPPQVQ